LNQGLPMLAQTMREISLECQAWQRCALLTPFEGTTVGKTLARGAIFWTDPSKGTQSVTFLGPSSFRLELDLKNTM
jgi:hypothetical protein